MEQRLEKARHSFLELEAPAEPQLESRVDEMLRQAMLASELAEQTGQMVFCFEEGNTNPINIPKGKIPAETAKEKGEGHEV